MKTIHSFIILLALTSFNFTTKRVYITEDETLVYESTIYGASGFLDTLKYHFKDIEEGRKLRIITVDLTKASIEEGCGYWDLINVINDLVEEDVLSISVLFPEYLIEELKENNFDHILAEIVIATENVPRIVPIFPNISVNDLKNDSNNALKLFTSSFYKISKSHSETSLIIDLPSFEVEMMYFDDAFENEVYPFAAGSHSLYKYLLRGIDFTTIDTIKLFNKSLHNYLAEIKIPNLKVVNYDSTLYSSYNEEEDKSDISLWGIVSAFTRSANFNSANKLTFLLDEKVFTEVYDFNVDVIKEDFGDKVNLHFY
jgi:hypothetical protein